MADSRPEDRSPEPSRSPEDAPAPDAPAPDAPAATESGAAEDTSEPGEAFAGFDPAALFHSRPRLLILSLFLIIVAGLSSVSVLPRLEDPEIRQRWALVLTPFPGADAARVEALVAEPIEDELLELAEVKEIITNARPGIAVSRVILKDSVAEVDAVWSRVRDELSDVAPRLPRGAADPELKTSGLRTATMIAGLTWTGDGPVSYGILNRLAEDLEAAMRRVPATQFTELHGTPREEILVEVDERRLSGLGLGATELAAIIARHDAKVSAGRLRDSRRSLLIEVAGEFDTLERIRGLPVALGEEGRTVPLGELAKVTKTVATPPSELALIDGCAGVTVSARMEPSARVDQWSETQRRVLAEFRRRLPRGITLETVFDQSTYTDTRLAALQGNLVLGGLFVVLIVFLMMGWRSALLVGSALPLATLMVLRGMQMLGLPIHQMSVTGLILALGLLIDNAIVIVDEVHERRREGRSATTAISAAVRHLAVPLFGSTLTTVLAFMPIVLLPGGAGEFVGSIAVTVSLALTSSLFLALTIIPALAGFMPEVEPGGPRRFWRDGLSSASLGRAWSEALALLFRRPIIGVVAASALPLFGFFVSRELPEQFFPPAERDQIQVALYLPRQASIERTREVALQARAQMLEHAEVEAVHWFLGRNAPMFYYNLVPGQDGSAFYAQALVQLRSAEGSGALIRRLQRELDAALPEVQALVLQLEQGPPFAAPIELRILGPDLDVLEELGERARARLSRIPGVVHTRETLAEGVPKLRVALDERRARLLGLDPVSVAGQLEASLEGLRAGSVLEATEDLPVRVRLRGRNREAASAVASLDLVTATGGPVPLAGLASLSVEAERSVVPRYNGRRCNTVLGYLAAGTLPATVQAPFARDLEAELELPAGYSIEFGGEAAERNNAVGNLMANVSVLMVLMVATLVLSFRSFRMAGIIGVVALFSVGLGLGSLWVAGYPFGFMAIVGTMGLIGVAINDAIVVLAAIRDDPEAREGDRDAVRRVVVRSTRHVLSTTVTTVAGFTPLLLDGGGFWPPLAVCIAGGVAGATLLALTFVPSAYLLVICRRCPFGSDA